jgi:hypothetical protein
MEKSINWFRVQVYYPVHSGLDNTIEDEDSELRRIRLKQLECEEYETEYAYLHLGIDPIVSLQPYTIIPKEAKNKKNLTEITLESGNIIYAVGKPDTIYQALNEYILSIQE